MPDAGHDGAGKQRGWPTHFGDGRRGHSWRTAGHGSGGRTHGSANRPACNNSADRRASAICRPIPVNITLTSPGALTCAWLGQRPPETSRIAPVTYEAWSPSSQMMASATSSAWPGRPSGVRCAQPVSTVGLSAAGVYFRVDKTRAHRIYPDALGRQFLGEPDCQRVYRRLRSRIIDVFEGGSETSRYRREQYNGTAAASSARREPARALPGAEIGAEDVDVEHPSKAIGSHVGKRHGGATIPALTTTPSNCPSASAASKTDRTSASTETSPRTAIALPPAALTRSTTSSAAALSPT